jgi:hypothetical protein
MNYDSLLANGFTVVPLPLEITSSFDKESFLKEQREFIQPTQDTLFVLGAFGAFGNPSSFHHPELRNLRHGIWNHIISSVFPYYFAGDYVQCVVDRFSKRCKGTTVGKESWHRDLSVPYETHGGDIIGMYGGWTNLDSDKSQYFSCIRGSHNEQVASSAHGFSKEDSARYSKDKRKVKIEVPPNHCLIFNERIIHEVVGGKVEADTYRLYSKYLVTRELTHAVWPVENVLKDLDAQSIMPLHIDEKGKYTLPPMFSSHHQSVHLKMLTEFSWTIKEEFLDNVPKVNRLQSTYENNETAPVFKKKPVVFYAKRYMPSLSHANLLFEPYTEQEKNFYRPTLIPEL